MLGGMRDIEPVDEYGALKEADVDTALRGLIGRYRAADLHARYSDAAKEAGRLPAHPVAFGQSLARRGYVRSRRQVDGIQSVVWDIGHL